jgi:hypothetical protein
LAKFVMPLARRLKARADKRFLLNELDRLSAKGDEL